MKTHKLSSGLLAFLLAASFMVLPFLLPSAARSQSKPTISPRGLTVGVTLTGSPLTGVCPYSMNLQWSATNASTCNKTGAWSGTAAASGSASVQVNAASSTYTLTCSSSTDTRTITWANPTQNTDGSAVSLGSNRLYHANDQTQIGTQNPAIVLTPATQTYLLTGLPAGLRYVGVTAVSSASMESGMSGIATATIVLPVGSQTVTAGCTAPPVPKPPTSVTIASTVWDTKGSLSGLSIKVGSDVGFIELNSVCLGDKAVITQGTDEFGSPVEYWQLDKNLTRIYPGVKPRPGILVGRCHLVQG